MYPSLLIWYSVVSYTVVSYPNLVVSNPSVNRFVPKPLIYSFPSLYTFIQNTSRASVSTDVDCCVVYFFSPVVINGTEFVYSNEKEIKNISFYQWRADFAETSTERMRKHQQTRDQMK